MNLNVDGSGAVKSMMVSAQGERKEVQADMKFDELLERNEAMEKRLSVLTQDQQDNAELLEKKDEELKQLKLILREMNESVRCDVQ